MGIYTAPGKLAYVVNGAALDTNLTLSPGTYNTTVQEWDNCGSSSSTPVTITVTSGGTGVTVTSPTNNSTIPSPAHYSATATSSCSKGVAAMGIYTAPYQLAYQTNGASLDTNLSLSPGTYNTTVQEWDNCGSSSSTPVSITVTSSGSGVTVTSPANNSTVSSPVHYVASAYSTCSKGVSAMGIYTADNVLAYSANGSTLDTNLTLNPGTYNTTVQEWDNCGGSAKTPIKITVSGGGGGGSTFYSLQTDTAGWTGYALLPPGYGICSSCKSSGPEVTWSWTGGISSPSMSGNATKTTIGGTTVFADVLWNNHLIGDFSSQGLTDPTKTLVPSLHNFTYDVYFYGTNLETSQALEFDINQFESGKSFIWGHECRVAGGHEWDTWNNQTQKWVDSGVACNPLSNAWNHLILQVERTSDDKLLFQSITFNGVTHTINRTDTPTSTSWFGITINYQIDGNKNQDPYTVYLDDLNFTYQ
jgi:major membrane immunogen (membrane-anchored lipoprotein)